MSVGIREDARHAEHEVEVRPGVSWSDEKGGEGIGSDFKRPVEPVTYQFAELLDVHRAGEPGYLVFGMSDISVEGRFEA